MFRTAEELNSVIVNKDVSISKSLEVIFRDLIHEYDINEEQEFKVPKHGSLVNWAKQGILLLNTALTVEHIKPNSHKSQWETFTNNVIKYISDNCDFLVFLLMGNNAKNISKFINSKHSLVKTCHPAADNYVDDGFYKKTQKTKRRKTCWL